MIIHSLPIAFLLNNPDGSPMSTMELFVHGGPVMWPILLVSLVGLTVIIERLLFILRENKNREAEVVEKMLEAIEHRDIEGALATGKKSNDVVARVLFYALNNKDHSILNAFIRASSKELTRFGQGMATLDTVITAAPLLGLLGTVTGMMKTFAGLGGGDIGAATATITGGVGEALIATACGLVIAVTALPFYNYLNARTEEAKHEMGDAAAALEMLMKKTETTAPFNR